LGFLLKRIIIDKVHFSDVGDSGSGGDPAKSGGDLAEAYFYWVDAEIIGLEGYATKPKLFHMKLGWSDPSTHQSGNAEEYEDVRHFLTPADP
jgi:hypothetical protein